MPLIFKINCIELWTQWNCTNFYANTVFVFHHKEQCLDSQILLLCFQHSISSFLSVSFKLESNIEVLEKDSLFPVQLCYFTERIDKGKSVSIIINKI